MYNINWRGDNCKNFYRNRNGYKPIGICNHITAGTRQSVFWWFTSPGNTNASSTFVVSRKGEIDQYVDLRHGAYTQGISANDGGYDRAIAPIVKDRKGVNPNYYMVSIEFEGYVEGHLNAKGEVELVEYGIDGSLTEEQFWAGCWLHKFIQVENERINKNRISLNSYYVEGHYRIDPKRKPNCPGKNFPWTRLYAELAVADTMTLEQYEERIHSQQSGDTKLVTAFAIAKRVQELESKLTGPYAKEAERKLLLLHPLLPQIGFTEDVSAANIAKRVVELYQKAQAGQFQTEALRKLLILEPFMREKGLL